MSKVNTVLGVVLGVLLVVLGVSSLSDEPMNVDTGVVDIILSRDFDPDNDWYLGDPQNYKVVLVEYSDFQCPACGAFYPVVKQLKEDLGDDLLFVYRHFPLVGIHDNARISAAAAEAAGLQGKFFEFHDLLFENQDEWENESKPEELFISYAEELGLDVDKFVEDMNSSEIKKKVDSSMGEALSMGLFGTPSFFVNGVKIDNPASYEEFKALLEENMVE